MRCKYYQNNYNQQSTVDYKDDYQVQNYQRHYSCPTESTASTQSSCPTCSCCHQSSCCTCCCCNQPSHPKPICPPRPCPLTPSYTPQKTPCPPPCPPTSVPTPRPPYPPYNPSTPGGYSQFRALTADELTLFQSVTSGLVGVTYEPLLVSTQVVNGTNYMFIALATLMNGTTTSQYYVSIEVYVPINGTPTLGKITPLYT